MIGKIILWAVTAFIIGIFVMKSWNLGKRIHMIFVFKLYGWKEVFKHNSYKKDIYNFFVYVTTAIVLTIYFWM